MAQDGGAALIPREAPRGNGWVRQEPIAANPNSYRALHKIIRRDGAFREGGDPAEIFQRWEPLSVDPKPHGFGSYIDRRREVVLREAGQMQVFFQKHTAILNIALALSRKNQSGRFNC